MDVKYRHRLNAGWPFPENDTNSNGGLDIADIGRRNDISFRCVAVMTVDQASWT
ncbi:MAG: hypothetical protein ACU836_09480 [Gammaproteobacteria bacterium]